MCEYFLFSFFFIKDKSRIGMWNKRNKEINKEKRRNKQRKANKRQRQILFHFSIFFSIFIHVRCGMLRVWEDVWCQLFICGTSVCIFNWHPQIRTSFIRFSFFFPFSFFLDILISVLFYHFFCLEMFHFLFWIFCYPSA